MTHKIYHVIWTQTAQQDLKRIIEYIAIDNQHQAVNIYRTIRQKAVFLRQMPFKGRIVPELNYFNMMIYRELIEPPWRIIYKTEEDKVLVLAVIDGRRNVEDILLDRFVH